MTTPFQSPFQFWADAWTKMAPQQSAGATTNPFASNPFASNPWMTNLLAANPWASAFGGNGAGASPFGSSPLASAPWLQAWTKAMAPQAAGTGVGPVDPMSALKLLWVDLPVEVATRLQRFASERAQDQMRLMTELAAEEGNVNPLMRHAAFIQQASLAWSTEMMEIMELYQERLLNTDRAPSEAPIHYPKAA